MPRQSPANVVYESIVALGCISYYLGTLVFQNRDVLFKKWKAPQ